eukprot:881084_1
MTDFINYLNGYLATNPSQQIIPSPLLPILNNMDLKRDKNDHLLLLTMTKMFEYILRNNEAIATLCQNKTHIEQKSDPMVKRQMDIDIAIPVQKTITTCMDTFKKDIRHEMESCNQTLAQEFGKATEQTYKIMAQEMAQIKEDIKLQSISTHDMYKHMNKQQTENKQNKKIVQTQSEIRAKQSELAAQYASLDQKMSDFYLLMKQQLENTSYHPKLALEVNVNETKQAPKDELILHDPSVAIQISATQRDDSELNDEKSHQMDGIGTDTARAVMNGNNVHELEADETVNKEQSSPQPKLKTFITARAALNTLMIQMNGDTNRIKYNCSRDVTHNQWRSICTVSLPFKNYPNPLKTVANGTKKKQAIQRASKLMIERILKQPLPITIAIKWDKDGKFQLTSNSEQIPKDDMEDSISKQNVKKDDGIQCVQCDEANDIKDNNTDGTQRADMDNDITCATHNGECWGTDEHRTTDPRLNMSDNTVDNNDTKHITDTAESKVPTNGFLEGYWEQDTQSAPVGADDEKAPMEHKHQPNPCGHSGAAEKISKNSDASMLFNDTHTEPMQSKEALNDTTTTMKQTVQRAADTVNDAVSNGISKHEDDMHAKDTEPQCDNVEPETKPEQSKAIKAHTSTTSKTVKTQRLRSTKPLQQPPRSKTNSHQSSFQTPNRHTSTHCEMSMVDLQALRLD